MTRFRLKGAEPARASKLKEFLARAAPMRYFIEQWRMDRFCYEAVLNTIQWRPGSRVLDVGYGYSTLPKLLAERHQLEMWAADDVSTGDWARPNFHTPQGQVTYVQELVGDPARSKLPTGYFDLVYSKMGVHFSPFPQDIVWRHMASLVKKEPGAAMIVMAGTASPVEGCPFEAFELLDHIRKLEDRAGNIVALGAFDPQFWREVEAFRITRTISPYLYCAYVMNVVGATDLIPEDLRAENYLLDPDTLFDPFYIQALNACTQRNPDAMKEGFSRTDAFIMCFETI